MNQDELHAAVCADPDAEAPRIAFADFLAPYRPERAQLVRLQLARFAADRAAGAVRSTQAAAEIALVGTHGADWIRYMESFVIPGGELATGVRFERGFIAHARVAIENVMGLGDRLAQLAPIQHLDVMPGEATGAPVRIASAKILGHLDSISLAGLGLTDDDAPALAACEALTRARWIDLSGNRLGVPGIVTLARSPVFATKVRVILDGNLVDPVEHPFYDYDGSVADVAADIPPAAIEDRVGAKVPWLRYPWGRADRVPDRYYARYV